MTGMRVLTAAVAALMMLAACGDEPPKAAVDAAAVADLEDRVSELEAELQDRVEELEGSDSSHGARLDRISERLTGSLAELKDKLKDSLKDSLKELRGTTEDAAANASSALGSIGSLERDLRILTERLDYHLRQHGGQ